MKMTMKHGEYARMVHKQANSIDYYLNLLKMLMIEENHINSDYRELINTIQNELDYLKTKV